MKAIAATLNGIESIAAEEIKELTKAEAKKIAEGRLLLETKSLKPLEKARTIKTLYSYLKHFSFKTEEEIYEQAKKIKFPIKKSFAARCHREGNHDFKSKNVEQKVGEIIFEKGHEVDLEKPKTTVYIEIIQDTCIIGILYKKDMQKREYKVRLNPASINACLAAAMIRLAEAKKGHIIADPFCKDGVIAIEASLMGVKQVYGFDESMNSVKNARINAQLAKASISFGKAEIDWLDTKFEKETVDRIITNPPFPARHRSVQEIEKTTKELISQARYVLKKDGMLVTVTQDSSLIEKYAKENNMGLAKELEVTVGNTVYKLQAFKP